MKAASVCAPRIRLKLCSYTHKPPAREHRNLLLHTDKGAIDYYLHMLEELVNDYQLDMLPTDFQLSFQCELSDTQSSLVTEWLQGIGRIPFLLSSLQDVIIETAGPMHFSIPLSPLAGLSPNISKLRLRWVKVVNDSGKAGASLSLFGGRQNEPVRGRVDFTYASLSGRSVYVSDTANTPALSLQNVEAHCLEADSGVYSLQAQRIPTAFDTLVVQDCPLLARVGFELMNPGWGRRRSSVELSRCCELLQLVLPATLRGRVQVGDSAALTEVTWQPAGRHDEGQPYVLKLSACGQLQTVKVPLEGGHAPAFLFLNQQQCQGLHIEGFSEFVVKDDPGVEHSVLQQEHHERRELAAAFYRQVPARTERYEKNDGGVNSIAASSLDLVLAARACGELCNLLSGARPPTRRTLEEIVQDLLRRACSAAGLGPASRTAAEAAITSAPGIELETLRLVAGVCRRLAQGQQPPPETPPPLHLLKQLVQNGPAALYSLLAAHRESDQAVLRAFQAPDLNTQLGPLCCLAGLWGECSLPRLCSLLSSDDEAEALTWTVTHVMLAIDYSAIVRRANERLLQWLSVLGQTWLSAEGEEEDKTARPPPSPPRRLEHFDAQLLTELSRSVIASLAGLATSPVRQPLARDDAAAPRAPPPPPRHQAQGHGRFPRPLSAGRSATSGRMLDF
eukprot:g40417.t1